MSALLRRAESRDIPLAEEDDGVVGEVLLQASGPGDVEELFDLLAVFCVRRAKDASSLRELNLHAYTGDLPVGESQRQRRTIGPAVTPGGSSASNSVRA